MRAAWCRAPSSWSISTIRTSTATPTRSRCSSAASARRWGSTSSKPSGGSAISWRRRAMRANSLALRMFERTIDLGDEGRYLIAVAGDAAEIDDEMRAFDEALAVTFCVLAVVLLLTTMFQVRFGLAPLKRISQGLAAIRAGTAERLEGTFPVEIAPLARETNELIDANREIVQRARTHVGNP